MASSEQIADFVAFSCGASVEDATKFLGLTQFNVEEAVNLYFSSQDNTSASTQETPNSQDYGFSYEDEEEGDVQEVRAAIPVKRQRLYEPSSSGRFLPGDFCFRNSIYANHHPLPPYLLQVHMAWYITQRQLDLLTVSYCSVYFSKQVYKLHQLTSPQPLLLRREKGRNTLPSEKC